jgi:hypothetical protein
MMPSSGLVEHLVVESVADGIYVSVRDSSGSGDRSDPEEAAS